MWDVVDSLKVENEALAGDMPKLDGRVEELQKEIEAAQRINRAISVFALIDTEKTVSIQKIISLGRNRI